MKNGKRLRSILYGFLLAHIRNPSNGKLRIQVIHAVIKMLNLDDFIE